MATHVTAASVHDLFSYFFALILIFLHRGCLKKKKKSLDLDIDACAFKIYHF